MAASKNKVVRQKETPKNRYVGQAADPLFYYHLNPAWNFNSCDNEKWAFTKENIGDDIWDKIIPFFKNLESQTWYDILVTAKNKHHSIEASDLNPIAQKRLTERYVEQDSIISLRLEGKLRIYGYIVGKVFHIMWYDTNHGDNDSCVCRSRKKHT